MKAKHFKSRHALLMSLTSLMLCVSMLFGATFAWFTDSVTSGVNRIVSGNLDVEITHQTAGMSAAENVSNTTRLFTKSMDNKDLLWEPEVMAYETFTVSNEGTLNLKYELRLDDIGENNLNGAKLADVIRAIVVNGAFDGNRLDASDFANAPTLSTFVQNKAFGDSINAGDTTGKTHTIVLYWPESDDDNNYNVNNGQTASDELKYLWVDLGITLVATQETGEYDSFSNDYDASSTQPAGGWASTISASATNMVATSGAYTGTDDNKQYAVLDTTVTDTATKVSATVPATALADYAKTVVTDTEGTITTKETQLKLTVAPTTKSDAVVTAATSGDTALFYDIDMTAITTKTTTDTEGNAVDNPTVTSAAVTATEELIVVTLPIGKDLDLQGIYHKTKLLTTTAADDTEDGEYYEYNSNTGILTLHVKTFSPFSIAYKYAGGLGTEAAPYLIANREQMQAISEEYDSGYAYYKWAGASTVDCSNWTAVNINGSFDGNGATFNNLDQQLFRSVGKASTTNTAVYTLRNFTVNANININGYGAAVIRQAGNNLTLDGITVHGKIEGNNGAAAFVCFGPGNIATDGDTVQPMNWVFKNCVSDAEIVATGDFAVGFIKHPYSWASQKGGSADAQAACLITIEDSIFTGKMNATSAKNALYFVGNANDLLVKTSYSDSFISTYGNPEGAYYEAPTSKTDEGVFLTGNYPGEGKKIAAYSDYGTCVDYYKGAVAATDVTVGTLPEKYSTFTVDKISGAKSAKVTLEIAPNDQNNKGAYLGTYMSETITLGSEATFSTDNIKYVDITINGTATSETGLSADGNTFNVINDSYGSTYNTATVRVSQYNSKGELLGVTVFSLPKA